MRRFLLLISSLLCTVLLRGQSPIEGNYRLLCLLVEFEDVHFSTEDPRGYFDALLNEEGFSGEGAVGSVKDYFSDNSDGRFVPFFQVTEPIRLEKKRQYYGRNVYDMGNRAGDAAAEEVIPDALAQLEESVDLSAYDALYFVYAGHDESQGGPADAIWAHQGHSDWYGNYACSSECSLAQGDLLSGIGPFCHELGHLLGLPDFYDTDGIVGGQAAGPEMYSLMSTGGHNQDDRRPPYLNALERYLLGWMGDIPEIGEGWTEIPPVQHSAAFRSSTQTEGEFFLLECRSEKGWDAGLPGGLMVYHVDRSDLSRWNDWRFSNKLNSIAAHPCFYPIRSSAPSQSLKADASLVGGNIVFPGLSQTLCLELKDWNGAYSGILLSNIAWDGEKASLYVIRDGGAQVNGIVRDGNGKALQGAVITVEGIQGYVLSGADGFFSLPLPENSIQRVYVLTATMADCRPARLEVGMSGVRCASVPVVLHKMGEADESTLSKFDPRSQFGYYSQPAIGAVYFSPEDLAPYAGRLLSEITFYPYIEPSFQGKMFVTVDIGSERVLFREVEFPSLGMYFRNTVSVSDAGIVIPEGVGMYVGMGSDCAGEGFYIGTVYPAVKGHSYWTEFGTEASAWKPMYVEKAGFYMDVALSVRIREQAEAADLGELAYAYIVDPGRGKYRAGESFQLQLGGVPTAENVRWWMDDAELAGPSVELSAGKHRIRAAFEYPDGRKEQLLLKIEAL